MMNTILTISKQNKIDKTVEKFMCNYPYASFFAGFIVMPILILIAVSIGTTAIILPIAFSMGWL